MMYDEVPAQAIFDDIVKRVVMPILKLLGFRKSAMSFHRRHRDVVQVINFQSSHGSSWDEKLFYVNVGLAFDAICHLTNREILEKPKEYECDARGIRARLEMLIDGAPARWSVHINSDSEPLARQLHDLIAKLAVELQLIDGVQAYRRHHWFERFRSKRETAQILYVLGDLDAAWNEVQDLCTLYADRQPFNRAEWWIEKLGLSKLTTRL